MRNSYRPTFNLGEPGYEHPKFTRQAHFPCIKPADIFVNVMLVTLKLRSKNMAAKRKTKKKAGSGGQGKRLTPEQREAIANEPSTMTLAVLAEKYGTSVPTIIRYRKSGKGRSTTAPKKVTRQVDASDLAGVQVSIEDDFIVIKLPKKSVLKDALGKLLA